MFNIQRDTQRCCLARAKIQPSPLWGLTIASAVMKKIPTIRRDIPDRGLKI